MRRTPQLAFLYLLLAILVMMATQSAWTQSTTGSIYGRVTDPTGASLPSAQVMVIGERTGVRYLACLTVKAITPSLVCRRPYSVEVKKDGFQIASIKNVVITIDQKQLLNFELKVGAVSEIMTVTTAPTMLQTQTSETGKSFSRMTFLTCLLMDAISTISLI